MSVWIKNQGEDSYETIFNMRMPYDVQYIRINKSAAHVSLLNDHVMDQVDLKINLIFFF